MSREIIDALRGSDGKLHMPQVGGGRKGKGRGANRGTVTSYSLPLAGTAMAKNMPDIETAGGSYDEAGVAHFPSGGAYRQYSDRTETEDGRYECN